MNVENKVSWIWNKQCSGAVGVTSLVSGGIRLPSAAARSRCNRRRESLVTESSEGVAEAAVNPTASQMDTGTRYDEATVATK